MDPREPHTLNRRQLLRAATAVAAGTAWARLARAADMPEVTRPRQTSGDRVVQPDWSQYLTLTVGPQKADLVGATDKALQAAADYVARLGGGTVRVLPGTYRLRNAVYLPSNVRLLGNGEDSVLIKEPSAETTIAEDSDWFDQELTLKDARGFELGDGICIQTTRPDVGGAVVIKRTLVARNGNRFKLDRPLRENVWQLQESTVSTLFPLVSAENASALAIEDIALDGNRDQNAPLNGNYAGCIWMQDCSDILIRGVTARHNHGDGISWQICHDVVVENCHCHDNADLGLHPGSGSQRPLIRNNRLERNGLGIFFCWGVKYGLAEGNTIRDSLNYGISIGHRDDENLVRDNDISGSGKAGILFRPERGEGFTAKGNRVEGNRIVDSGGDDGVGIDIQGVTAGNTIARNDLRETRAPAQRIGIRIGEEAGENTLTDNRIEGFATPVSDMRNGSL